MPRRTLTSCAIWINIRHDGAPAKVDASLYQDNYMFVCGTTALESEAESSATTLMQTFATNYSTANRAAGSTTPAAAAP